MRTDRSHFRVEYPAEVRPVMKLRDQEMPIVNLSEEGILFTVDKKFFPQIGKTIRAEIVFEDAVMFVIVGKILRSTKKGIAMSLTQGIPLQRIMSEQRNLLSRYGTLKEPDPEQS